LAGGRGVDKIIRGYLSGIQQKLVSRPI